MRTTGAVSADLLQPLGLALQTLLVVGFPFFVVVVKKRVRRRGAISGGLLLPELWRRRLRDKSGGCST